MIIIRTSTQSFIHDLLTTDRNKKTSLKNSYLLQDYISTTCIVIYVAGSNHNTHSILNVFKELRKSTQKKIPQNFETFNSQFLTRISWKK